MDQIFLLRTSETCIIFYINMAQDYSVQYIKSRHRNLLSTSNFSMIDISSCIYVHCKKPMKFRCGLRWRRTQHCGSWEVQAPTTSPEVGFYRRVKFEKLTDSDTAFFTVWVENLNILVHKTFISIQSSVFSFIWQRTAGVPYMGLSFYSCCRQKGAVRKKLA
jgi:hypothetical protein